MLRPAIRRIINCWIRHKPGGYSTFAEMVLLFKIGFLEVGWVDFIDIALVSVLLYQVYKLIRGSIAVNIFLGILALYLVYLIVRAAQMELLTTILGTFMNVGVLAMIILFVLMKLIHRHYSRVETELKAAELSDEVLPSRSHAIVLVSSLHLPSRRALRYARATRPDTLEAITVNVDERDTRTLVSQWEESDIVVPLKVLASPYREITRPVINYVRRVRREAPRDVVTVFIPEYVVGHWWEQILHNQSALRLKTRLLFEPGVMVTSVPWQLNSSENRARRGEHAYHAPGDIRRGFTPEDSAK